jgi:shikimate dehydrogenase
MFFHPDEIFLFVRDPDKATEMLKGYGHRNLVTLCRQYPVDEIFMDCSVVVNATPIGTKGRPGDMATSIVPPDRKLIHDSQIVYDMVYNPVVTPLLKSAAEAGADTISGIEMLIAQAAGSFRLWTGQALPVDRVRNILMQEIGQGS